MNNIVKRLLLHDVGNLVVFLRVVIDAGMANTILVLVSQFVDDQLLWLGARLCL